MVCFLPLIRRERYNRLSVDRHRACNRMACLGATQVRPPVMVSDLSGLDRLGPVPRHLAGQAAGPLGHELVDIGGT